MDDLDTAPPLEPPLPDAPDMASQSQCDAAIIIPGIADDGTLYPIEKMAAHRRPIFHLAVSVFVFSGDRLLIQQRAHGKYHCGGQWANTCCTHPHWGESASASAARRLHEELGIELPITPVRIVEYRADVGNGLWEHERVHMFRGEADAQALAVDPDPHEVAATRWVTADTLRQEIASEPEAFTPWFRIYVERFPDLAF